MRVLLFLFIISSLLSCSTNKVTEFKITNKNNYPISVKVTTNNIQQTFAGIQPEQTFVGNYDWTALEKKDGQWVFRIQNDITKGADEFTHGYYTNGELFNYVTLECQGDQLKVQITE
jgi:hypothetical protein